jgi:riboflavin kinase/FMN adenylyltransferase
VTAPVVLTVGTFDGVHRGHRAVLEEIARRARARGGTSVLVTFDAHPLEVVNPQAAPLLLTLPDEKRAALADAGLDRVEFLPFTEALRALGPEQFVREVLEARFRLAELVIGHDHGFGRGRAGDVATLRRVGQADGFAVDVVPAVLLDGRPISSTLIRRAVAGGDLDTAERALGRPYGVTGVVGRGAGRGRAIGVPTINLAAAGRRLRLLGRMGGRDPRGDGQPRRPTHLRGVRPDAGGPPVRRGGRAVRPVGHGGVPEAPARRAAIRVRGGPRRAAGAGP